MGTMLQTADSLRLAICGTGGGLQRAPKKNLVRLRLPPRLWEVWKHCSGRLLALASLSTPSALPSMLCISASVYTCSRCNSSDRLCNLSRALYHEGRGPN